MDSKFTVKDIVGTTIIATVCVLGVYALFTNYFRQENKKTSTALNPRQYQKFKLIEKENVSHNTRRFRFALQSRSTELGLPCGKYISFRFFEKNSATGEEEEIRRPYTPITSNRDKGYFDVMIKVYPDGKMTSHLDKLRPNKDIIEARGPLGEINYVSPGFVSVKKGKDMIEHKVSKIAMICGGTGITPMLQLIDEITYNRAVDKTQVSTIFANVSIDDILMRTQLEELRRKYDNIHIKFTIDKGPTDGREWNEEIGYVTPDMIKNTIFPPANDVVVFLCGPPIMVKICKSNLGKLGYDEKSIISF